MSHRKGQGRGRQGEGRGCIEGGGRRRKKEKRREGWNRGMEGRKASGKAGINQFCLYFFSSPETSDKMQILDNSFFKYLLNFGDSLCFLCPQPHAKDRHYINRQNKHLSVLGKQCVVLTQLFEIVTPRK